jgi:DHA2 family methylenomycin A resistance protein-like MFS transporter
MASTATPRASGRRGSRRRRRGGEGLEPIPREAWTRLAACTAAAALLQLDGTVITVALPNVAHSLHISSSSTSIILSAYFAAYAIMLFPGGHLVDRLGARRIALIGLVIFAVGAALGAVVNSLALLTVTRAIQGIGAGLVSPAALAGAISGFPPDRRGSALGIWGASAGMANLVGPLVGGLLTIAWGWRADWWALVPMGLAAAYGVVRFVPSIVHRVGEGGRQRVLNSTVVAASLVAGITFAVMIGTFYLAEQYLQKAVGYSALGASAVLIIVALFVGLAAPLAGGLVDQYGERVPTMLGFLLAGIPLAVLALHGISLHGIGTAFLLIPIGFGLGMLFVPVSRAALNSTPPESHGRTSAVLSFMRLAGAGIGAGLAGVALTGGAKADTVHTAVAVAAGVCIVLGIPLAAMLGSRSAASGGRPVDDGGAGQMA